MISGDETDNITEMMESPRRRAESLPPRMATPQAAPRGPPGLGDVARGGGDFPLPGEPYFASQYQRKEADWYRGFGDKPAPAGGDAEVTFKHRGLGARLGSMPTYPLNSRPGSARSLTIPQ